MQGYSAGDGSSAALTDGSRNVASVRKVNKLLDVSVNEHFRDLVTYVDDAFPASMWDDLGNGRGGGGTNAQQPLTTPPQLMGASLRNTLEDRVMLLHSQFLREFKTVYDAYSEANVCIGQLDKISADLDRQLSNHTAETEALMTTVNMLRTEREMILEREREVRKFKEKYQFSREEQQMLESGVVDIGYLDLLDKARTIHLKCKEMVVKGAAGLLGNDAGVASSAASLALQQQQYSAAQVMESSFMTLLKASEKISKYVESLTVSVMSADVPEIPSLYVRCIHALQRDNRAQWQLALREIVRVRKASVARRYFHLMTNGSPLTASGTYLNSGNNVNGGGRSAQQSGGHGMRPLEAELDDPVYFFSSLFAWLHQSIVEEDDLLSVFVSSAYCSEGGSSSAGAANTNTNTGGGDDNNAKESSSLSQSPSSVKSEMLDELFENLVKNIWGMLNGIMKRVRQNTEAKLNAHSTAADGNMSTRISANSSQGDRNSGLLGGRLIGGIGRFFTGQRESGVAGSGSNDSTSLPPLPPHIFANYERHSGRGNTMSLQVSPALATLSQAMVTSFQTEGLFVFYGNTTFTPLLGPNAALTRFVTVTGKLEVLSLFYDLVKQLSTRLLTTTSEVVVSQLPVLELVKNSSPFSPCAHLAHASFVCQLSDEDLDAAKQLQQRGGEPAGETLIGILRSGDSSSPSSLGSQFLHMLGAYVLETPPEMHEALRILRVMLTEIEKTAPLQHKTGPSDTQKQVQPQETREEDLLPFVNTLLSFRKLLQQQNRIVLNIDTASLLVLRMNVASAFTEVLRSSVYTVSLIAAVQAEIDRDAGVFEGITSSVLCWYHGFLSATQVSTQLLPPLSEIVKANTSVSAGIETGGKEANVFLSVVQKHLLGIDHDTPSGAAQQQQQQRRLWMGTDGSGSDIDSGIRVLQNFYASVGATGMLTVPLLTAVESARLREKLNRDISRNLCWVYELIFHDVSDAVAAETAATSTAHAEALDQLEPHKLRVLLDVHNA